jgi:hypothetical protein
MVGFKQIICALLLLGASGVAVAQNNTNSPYTRYGYGDLSNKDFGYNKAMGGVAYGIRNSSHINPSNPASYTAIDSLTFLFEGGVSLQNDNISDGDLKMNVKNSSLDYIAMQFRAHKRVGVTFGMLPYSNVGYNVYTTYTETTTSPAYTKQLIGDGGLHQAFGGVGIKILNNLSVGANFSFMWGDISRSLSMIYPSYTTTGSTSSTTPSYIEASTVTLRGFEMNFGAQYTQKLSKKSSVTIGAVYSPKRDLNSDVTVSTSGSVVCSRDSIASFGLPQSYGAGFTYNYDGRLTVGFDYSFEEWSKVPYMNDYNAFCNRSKYSVGAEYMPSRATRNYLKIVKYRVGAYYTDSYYKLENGNRAAREYGLSAGFGLPLPRTRSLVNITAQYIHVKGLQQSMIDENILRLSIGVTFNERWFFKRKVD